MRVQVKPEMLRWARNRSRIDEDLLAKRFPQLDDWERGNKQPTLKQLESFAKATHAPIGFLFLPEPPVEHVPIPDFRTTKGHAVGSPSPDLLDTVYACQQRQDWYRDYARGIAEDERAFVGSATTRSGVVTTAAHMRAALEFPLAAQRESSTWTDALRAFIGRAEAAGVLVMVNGVVGSNTHRKLDPEEFRGFALADKLAPLVFINGADTKAAQTFTLAHELAHIWLGETALTDADGSEPPKETTERWCNEVAAEFLVPMADFRGEHQHGAELHGELDRLAKVFKVSTLVVLRRMRDAGTLVGERYWKAYKAELDRLRSLPKSSGGNFYLTQPARNSRRFSRALIADTLEGNTLFLEASRMLGISSESTFREMSAQLGYMF